MGQKIDRIKIIIMLVIVLIIHNLSANSAFKIVEVQIHMKDGIKLKADAFIPDVKEKIPVILIRTPYGKHQHRPYGEFWAKNGYVAIIQDTRGKWGSEGNFSPFVNELDDGLSTLDWITKQE